MINRRFTNPPFWGRLLSRRALLSGLFILRSCLFACSCLLVYYVIYCVVFFYDLLLSVGAQDASSAAPDLKAGVKEIVGSVSPSASQNRFGSPLYVT